MDYYNIDQDERLEFQSTLRFIAVHVMNKQFEQQEQERKKLSK